MRIVAALALVLCSLSSLATADPRTPDQVVQQTADQLAARIEGRQK